MTLRAPGMNFVNQSVIQYEIRMWSKHLFIALFIFGYVSGQSQEDSSTPANEDEASKLAEGEQKLSEQILQIMEHFKERDPVGLPGANIPDPYSVPDTKQSFSVATMNFKNMAVHGISKFRIQYINAEIGAMEVKAAMVIDTLQVLGNYTLSTWLSRSAGPFTVNLKTLKVMARGNLGVERDGKLRAQDINIDLAFDAIDMNFQNLGFLGSLFQGIVNSVGTFLFDSIKPFILKEAYTKIRTAINSELDEVAGDMQFSNSISPLDMVIAELRKKVRQMEYDPYKVKNYNTTVSVFSVSLSNTWLTGISSFHRVGNITVKMENNTAIADFEIGTQKLEGITQWDISAVGGLMSRAGTASFSVEYLAARIVLAQPLDTRKRPEFRNLELEIGNIQVRCDGAGTLDYVIELVVNILPNLLRYQIMDAIENPLKEKVQLELNKINVEEVIKQEIPKVDELQQQGLKLSALKSSLPPMEDEVEDDEFFDFDKP